MEKEIKLLQDLDVIIKKEKRELDLKESALSIIINSLNKSNKKELFYKIYKIKSKENQGVSLGHKVGGIDFIGNEPHAVEAMQGIPIENPNGNVFPNF
jgi:hypothetical protein